MTIQPVFDMEEDEDSEEISEHGKREKFSTFAIVHCYLCVCEFCHVYG